MSEQNVQLLHVVGGLADLVVNLGIKLNDALVLLDRRILCVRLIGREGQDILTNGALRLVVLKILIK
jgi:hypothetical protein